MSVRNTLAVGCADGHIEENHPSGERIQQEEDASARVELMAR